MPSTTVQDAAAWYAQRLVSAEQALSHVKSRDRIWISTGQRVPLLLDMLIARSLELEGVTVRALPTVDASAYDPSMRAHLKFDVRYAGPNSRDAVNSGNADYHPWWVWGGNKGLDDGRSGHEPHDVSFVNVTPPNENGYCCFGNTLWDAKSTIKRSTLTIAEVGEHLPRTYGDTWVHVTEIDWFVENSPTVVAFPQRAEDPWDQPIAEYVASLIKDGDTLQIGTGSTSGHIPGSGVLDDKHDLGYFAELTVAGSVELARKGVVTSKYMTTHPGKFVTTTAGGTPEDIAFINGNPMFEFYDVEYIHHPGVIARNDNMVAINNALTIDFTGQIGAGQLGPDVYSGTGGHLSYAMGAFLSRGGRYICVLPSTAVGGTKSRIVPQLESGQIVTVPRDIADIVVSEYGIAHLLNKTERERTEELIAIAHPDFRGELRKAAAGTHAFLVS